VSVGAAAAGAATLGLCAVAPAAPLPAEVPLPSAADELVPAVPVEPASRIAANPPPRTTAATAAPAATRSVTGDRSQPPDQILGLRTAARLVTPSRCGAVGTGPRAAGTAGDAARLAASVASAASILAVMSSGIGGAGTLARKVLTAARSPAVAVQRAQPSRCARTRADSLVPRSPAR
jgi:hypothetical protein